VRCVGRVQSARRARHILHSGPCALEVWGLCGIPWELGWLAEVRGVAYGQRGARALGSLGALHSREVRLGCVDSLWRSWRSRVQGLWVLVSATRALSCAEQYYTRWNCGPRYYSPLDCPCWRMRPRDVCVRGALSQCLWSQEFKLLGALVSADARCAVQRRTCAHTFGVVDISVHKYYVGAYVRGVVKVR
jgi:hypothetical protein